MNIQEYREFLSAMLDDYDSYLQDCINLLQSNPDTNLSKMNNDEKKRYLIECRQRFIEGCVAAYEDDQSVTEHIDG